MRKEWREIGEGGDWEVCETEAWFKYCNSSPEHDTRKVYNSAAEMLIDMRAMDEEEE
jgi:hypothetical protein